MKHPRIRLQAYPIRLCVSICLFPVLFLLTCGMRSSADSLELWNQAWEHGEESVAILSALQDSIPQGYAFGPVEWLSGWDISINRSPWYVTLNHVDPYLHIDPEKPGDRPARLQVWMLSESQSSRVPTQEFLFDTATVYEMGWLELNNERLLYVITGHLYGNTDIACFRVGDDGRLQLVSEEDGKDSLTWFIADLVPWGPVFICAGFPGYMVDPEQRPENINLYFVTYNHGGFFRNYTLRLGDLISSAEIDSISTGAELRETVSVELRMTLEWRTRLRDSFSKDGMETRSNLDGSSYLVQGMFGGWREARMAGESE